MDSSLHIISYFWLKRRLLQSLGRLEDRAYSRSYRRHIVENKVYLLSLIAGVIAGIVYKEINGVISTTIAVTNLTKMPLNVLAIHVARLKRISVTGKRREVSSFII